MDETGNQLLTSILRDVSRSFYLTLRILPRSIRRQIGTAYLLARLTDTVADTEVISVERRLETLNNLRERILGSRHARLDMSGLAAHQGSAGEQALLERWDDALALLDLFEADDLRLIRQVLATITSGQELDIRRFGSVSASQLNALRTMEELDDYTYRVAGCVGEFWTRLCRSHLFPNAALDESDLLTKGVRFGKGLQLVNVLRDLSKDLRLGRCYLPSEKLAGAGLTPEDLLKPENEPRLHPIYSAYLDEAEGHLRAGWLYTCMLPYSCLRVRLACAWPILIGLETVHLLRRNNPLDSKQSLKVGRSQVKRLIAASVFFYPFPPLWKALAGKQASRSGIASSFGSAHMH